MTKLRSRQAVTTVQSGSTELVWLRDEIEQSHLILDGYGVPRIAAGNGPDQRRVTLTIAGRLRLALGDPTRKARHAASEQEAIARAASRSGGASRTALR